MSARTSPSTHSVEMILLYLSMNEVSSADTKGAFACVPPKTEKDTDMNKLNEKVLKHSYLGLERREFAPSALRNV